MNWWIGLLAILFIVLIVWIVEDDRIKEEAKQEKKDLLREKDKLLARQKIKERLQALLTRRYNWRRNIGYIALLSGFGGTSLLLGFLLQYGCNLAGFSVGVGITEGVLFIVTPFVIHKSVEFRHILNECAPFVKKKVFGEYIKIDDEIKETKTRIVDIDSRIITLNRIIAA